MYAYTLRNSSGTHCPRLVRLDFINLQPSYQSLHSIKQSVYSVTSAGLPCDPTMTADNRSTLLIKSHTPSQFVSLYFILRVDVGLPLFLFYLQGPRFVLFVCCYSHFSQLCGRYFPFFFTNSPHAALPENKHVHV